MINSLILTISITINIVFIGMMYFAGIGILKQNKEIKELKEERDLYEEWLVGEGILKEVPNLKEVPFKEGDI